MSEVIKCKAFEMLESYLLIGIISIESSKTVGEERVLDIQLSRRKYQFITCSFG